MARSSQIVEPPQNSGRFTQAPAKKEEPKKEEAKKDAKKEEKKADKK